MKPRDCGGCTQCCKVMLITELAKPQGKWCEHCKVGSGCAIQGAPERPKSCGDFDCLWRQGYGTEEMRPDKSKVVMATTTDGGSLVLHLDASRPDAHRTPTFDIVIDRMTKDGGRVFVVIGDKRAVISRPGGVP